MANVIWEDKFTYTALGMSFVNVICIYAFIRILRKKIEKVVFSSQANENEEEEVYIQKYTIMF